MKTIFLNISLFVLFAACINGKDKKNNNAFESSHDSSAIIKNMQVDIKNKFPFGSSTLVKHNFPAEFQTRYEIDDNTDTAKYEHDEALKDVMNYYNTLNRGKSIKHPPIKNFEYVKVGNYDKWEFNDSIINSFDSCLYKLPNIGSYECYYAFKTDRRNRPQVRNFCYAAGNLVLINKKLSKVKIINIFVEIQNQYRTQFRLFYIQTDGTIELFELKSGEGLNNFKKTHAIKILKNGELNINEIK